MPKKQSKAKKSSQTRAKNAIQADIAKAVDRIAEEMQRSVVPVTVQNDTYELLPTIPSFRNRRALLWVGVTVMTTAIFVMWIWNARAMFYDIKNTKSAEALLLENAKDDIENILAKSPPKPAIFETAKPVTVPSDQTSNEAITQTLQSLFAGAVATTTLNSENLSHNPTQ